MAPASISATSYLHMFVLAHPSSHTLLWPSSSGTNMAANNTQLPQTLPPSSSGTHTWLTRTPSFLTPDIFLRHSYVADTHAIFLRHRLRHSPPEENQRLMHQNGRLPSYLLVPRHTQAGRSIRNMFIFAHLHSY
jgi:hypothetical protein